jgi:hypothetical protein
MYLQPYPVVQDDYGVPPLVHTSATVAASFANHHYPLQVAIFHELKYGLSAAIRTKVERCQCSTHRADK